MARPKRKASDAEAVPAKKARQPAAEESKTAPTGEKRGRGRPRKNPEEKATPKPAPTGPKRGRGRPRKVPTAQGEGEASAPKEQKKKVPGRGRGRPRKNPENPPQNPPPQSPEASGSPDVAAENSVDGNKESESTEPKGSGSGEEEDEDGNDDDDDDDNDHEKRKFSYWLMKAEPESRFEKGVDVKFSIDDLKAAREPEPWDGVRNNMARNNLRAMKKGDYAFFYHSNCKLPGIAGTMEIVREHSPDESAFNPAHPYYDEKSSRENPKWVVVHVEFRRKFKKIITLHELKSHATPGGPLENMQTLKQSRLSVTAVSPKEWEFIMKLAEPEDGSD